MNDDTMSNHNLNYHNVGNKRTNGYWGEKGTNGEPALENVHGASKQRVYTICLNAILYSRTLWILVTINYYYTLIS